MRLVWMLVMSSSSLLACSGTRMSSAGPGVVVPVPVADGNNEKPKGKAGAAPSASAPSAAKSAAAAPGHASTAPPSTPVPSAPPDPEPLRTKEQLEYTLLYADGAVRVESVRRLKFEKPIVTARRMGRFAVELWVGHELIERVRFDFPLLAAEEAPSEHKRLKEPPALTRGPLNATLLVPFSGRARRAVLLDRATNQQTELTWPPTPTPTPAAPPAKTP